MRTIIPQVIFFTIFWLLFHALGNKTIYENTLGIISTNEVINQDGSVEINNRPFSALTKNSIINYDGIIYNHIKEHGYNLKGGGSQIFAFFPLFPFLWKITFWPSAFISVLTILLYLIGLWLIARNFSSEKNKTVSWSIACLPGIIVFVIPYSEALFACCVALAIHGYLNKRYIIYFTGMMLASMTRSVSVIVLLSFIFTELVFYFSEKKLKQRIISLLRNTLPIILGTLLVSLIQLSYNSGGFFRFVEEHKYWNHSFGIPGVSSDWSHEGFGINLASYFIICFPLISLLMISSFNIKPRFSRGSYLQILSMTILIGSFMFVLFFQQGNLHSLFRYIICSPFLFYLYYSIDVKNFDIKNRFFMFAICFLSGLFMLSLSSYSSAWNFNDTGFFILYGAVALWLFNDMFNFKIYRLLLGLLVFANAVWSAYLLNNYISNSWLFV